MIIARLSGELCNLTNGKEELKLHAGDIQECIDNLEERFPGSKERFCDNQGEVLASISIFVNGDNIDSLQGMQTPLKEGDEVDFMSAFAGG
ncbi:MAG: MoaD family protein [Thermodesulfobacteriota bacterium]|nr:MoaD family protein [Thermodesulfobacteriota bacterium]